MKHAHILQIPRLQGLCDGVFAIAMTILVFDIRLPNIASEFDLPTILVGQVLNEIFMYIGSFIILGAQWIGISFQHGFLHRVNRHYLWANIFYLMTVGIIPFSARLLINYPENTASIVFYSINLIGCSIAQLLVWQCGVFFKIYSKIEYN